MSRLHEFDAYVSIVREGISCVVPLPLISLFTASELETMVRLGRFYWYTVQLHNKPVLIIFRSRSAGALISHWVFSSQSHRSKAWQATRRYRNGFGRSWNPWLMKKNLCFWGLFGVAQDYLGQSLTSGDEILWFRSWYWCHFVRCSFYDFKTHTFQVLDKYNPPDYYLPESYTCFFLLKLPRYSSKV